MPDGALDDVVVIEISSGVAGPYCGRLLADLGAQVIKVEPPTGDKIRSEAPMSDGESAFFAWLNADKLGVQLDSKAGKLADLSAQADIILHDFVGDEAHSFEAQAQAVNPAAVVISLSPYGRSGPREDWLATPLTEWATGGYFYIAGDPGREPLALPYFQAEYHAGLHAAIAALAGLWHSRETGEGQLVEISHQEATLNDHSWLTTTWTHEGNVQKRTGSLFVPCLDGFVYLFQMVPYQNLFILIERLDMLEDESLFFPGNWWTRFPEIRAAFGEWAATRTKQEIYHAAQELRIAVSPVNTMADLAVSEQLRARDWFEPLTVGGRTIQGPGFPYKLMGTPCSTNGRAPAIGQHQAQVFSPEFEWANAGVERPKPPFRLEPAEFGPLRGLRVIEVTANWAGPIGGRHLADLGADVIKIELQTKPATRSLINMGGDIWPEHYHRSGYFNKLNRNKRAIALDLSKTEGKAVFMALIAKADIVIENNAARVMGQLGLGYEDLRKVNDQLVMCSMAGYGATGPDRSYSAYGSNIETSSGLASLLGYGPNEFFGTGSFYADPVTGNHGTVAVLAALHARRSRQEGQWIDVALLEAVLPFFAQPFLEYQITGHVPQPNGNAWGAGLFGGAFQTAGADCWLAISCATPEQVAALGAAIGASASFADGVPAAGAREAFAEWLRLRDHNEAADLLQAAGVPAAPVMINWEFVTDNHLNDRGYFVPVRHPTAGTVRFPGFAWRFSATPAAIRFAAPLFAEHNEAVFRDLLGMTDTEIAALYAAGATGNEPIYAAGPSL
jgi:crotonobetainyl-CoA:carnitine CoA-transferase CaiB-like acyl-CoA transferase